MVTAKEPARGRFRPAQGTRPRAACGRWLRRARPLASSAISGLSNVARGVSKSGRAGARAVTTGPLRPGRKPPGRSATNSPIPARDAMDDFIRTMGRAGADADSLGAYVDDALASDPGRGRTFVDAGAPAAVNRMKYPNQGPRRNRDQGRAPVRRTRPGRARPARGRFGARRDGARISTQELGDTVEQLYRTEGPAPL